MLSARIDEIAAAINAHTPELTPDGSRVALATYRLLADGAPASMEAIAERAVLKSEEAEVLVSAWPGVFRDDAQRIVGFWGLSIVELGPHRLRVDSVELSAWCAWDTLFLPELLGRPADVRSVSPLDGEPISLRVSPEGIENVSPSGLVMSMVSSADSADFIRTFCHQVHFFASGGEGRRWVAARDGAFVMSVADGFELGRRVNRFRYGDAVSPAA